MKYLPDELYLILLTFLTVEDGIQWASCMKKWYHQFMKKKVRVMKIKKCGDLDTTVSTLLKRIPLLIENSYSQLDIFVDNVSFEWMDFPPISSLFSLLKGSAFNVRTLSVDMTSFIDLFKKIDEININTLTVLGVHDPIISEETFMNLLLTKFRKLVKLELLQDYISVVVPFIPTLKVLNISNFSESTYPLHPLYFSQLHTLSLFRCGIIDVTPLDSIPNLSLLDCNNITSVAGLNRNQRISIESCANLTDFSKSFQYSQVITIDTMMKQGTIDLTHFQNVSKLTLRCINTDMKLTTLNSNVIPYSVRRCYLSGVFAAALDLHITEYHHLQELSITSEHTIESLEDLGLERLSIIRCTDMSKLTTTKGLGEGLNRKITLFGCNAIEDFHSLQHVPEISISNCQHFRDLEDVKHVQIFKLSPQSPISFNVNTLQSLKKLSLHDYSFAILPTFIGLEMIPHLFLQGKSVETFIQYVKTGGKLYNRSIKFQLVFPPQTQQMIALYHDYLQETYLLSQRENYLLLLSR